MFEWGLQARKRSCIRRKKKKQTWNPWKVSAFQIAASRQIVLHTNFARLPNNSNISSQKQCFCGRSKDYKTSVRVEKKDISTIPTVYICLCFSRGLGHIFYFCYCLNIGSEEPAALSHKLTTQQWRQENKYLLNNVHFLCLLYFPWLQWELEDLQESQIWFWRMIYASCIYFPMIFFYLETFTDLNGRPVQALIPAHVYIWKHVIHARNCHEFSFVPELSYQSLWHWPWHNLMSESLHKLCVSSGQLPADPRVGLPKVGAAGVPICVPRI